MESIKTRDQRFLTFNNAFKNNIGVIVPLIMLITFASIFAPRFFTAENMFAILRAISTTALIAFSMTFVLLCGQIDLSIGALVGISGCLWAMLLKYTPIPSYIGVLVVCALGAMLGFVNGTLVTRLKMPSFIVTIAMMYVLRGIAYVSTGGQPLAVPSDTFFQFIGGGFIGLIPIAALYVPIAFIMLWVVLNRTKFGRHVYAVGGNPVAAEFSGINVKMVTTITFIISGTLSAFGGVILTSRLNSGQPTLGTGMELDVIAACIVGGMSITGGIGTLTGTLMGVIMIQIISNMLNLLAVQSFVQLIVKGIIVIAFVYVNALRSELKLKSKKV